MNEAERADMLRAATGYALGEDALGLGRLHEQYAALMARTPDAQAFAILSAPLGTSGKKFRDIARAAASTDTLNGFLRDMQARCPDASPVPQPAPAAALPGIGAPSSSTVPSAKPEASEAAPAAGAAGKTAQR